MMLKTSLVIYSGQKWLQIMVVMFKMNKELIAKSAENLDIVPTK